MKQIELTQGKFAIVDDEDFEWLNQWKWYVSVGYAMRYSPRINGSVGGAILMHREIMKTPDGMQVDHINHNKLDNRRVNLRNCTVSENQQNRGVQRNNKIGIKGVSKRKGKYRAVIMVNKHHIHLGYFNTADEASNAYNIAAEKYNGNFAQKNPKQKE